MASVQDALKARFSKLKDDALWQLNPANKGSITHTIIYGDIPSRDEQLKRVPQSSRNDAQILQSRNQGQSPLQALKNATASSWKLPFISANTPEYQKLTTSEQLGSQTPKLLSSLAGIGPVTNAMTSTRGLVGIGATLGIGGGLNKLAGGSFTQGVKGTAETLPSIYGIGKFTNPAITGMANSISSKINNPVSRTLINRGVTGLGNIPEGIAMSGGMGQSYSPTNALIDFGIGALTGSGNRLRISEIDANVYRNKNNALKEHIQTLEQKVKSLSENGGSKTAIKQYQKAIDNAYREIVKNRQMAGKLGLKAGIVDNNKAKVSLADNKAQKELAQDFQITKENPQKLGRLEEKVFGSATPQSSAIEQGNKTGAGMISDSLRKLEAKVSEYAGKGLESQRNSVRNISRLLQGFAGGLGKPRDLIARVGKFRGGVDYSTELAIETQKHGTGLVGNDIKKLERIHAVMDPDLATTKVKESDLLPDEKEALDFFKTVSDYINDTNFKNGFIPRDLWEKNKGGKYIARAYEAFDFPPEVADIVKQAKGKFDLNPFVKRKDVDQWKLDEAIRDPAYLLSKRLQQTVMNDETHKMFAYLKGTNFASDTPKPGFIQLSESKAFGELSGKYVRKDVLDDIRGLFFANETANKAYDVLKAYDRNPLRQTQKRLLTIFNPAVAFGNKASNFVYAHLSGINPVTFEKNKLWAGNEIKTKGQMYRRMMQDGLIGTDAMKAELANFSVKLQKEYKDPNVVRKILDGIQGDYSKSDDVAKISAMKTFLDRGYSYEESARRVYDGFQNYRTVGWLYDIGSKLPVFGNPFVRFAGDLTRMTKNQMINHPARVIGTVIMWKVFTDVMSSASGETPEDRATREGRIGASRLPLTNVSLEVQTPWGAVDASRLLGGLYANNPTGENSPLSDIKRLSPIQVPDIAGATQSGNYRRALTGLTTSPDIGPAMGLLLDTDFRGKSIADPNQNKYTGSLLTPTEQNMNRLRYGVNAYVPYARDIDNIASAIQGKANMYGQIRNTPQAVLRTFPGIKVEQYGPEQADLQRLKDAGYQQASNDYYDKQITAVKKQQTAGTITPEEAKKKIEYITSQKKNVYGNGYVKSKDAPNGLLPTIGTYTKSLITDPGQTIQAVLAGNPIRKVEGDTVILERKKGLSGDTDPRTERDHKIALTLGGDNSDSNLQYLTKAENRAKGVVDTYLYKLMKEGKITREEAQKRDLNWKDEIKNLPKATQRKLVMSLSEISTAGEASTDTKTAKVAGKGVFILKNPETGSETVIDLSQPITKPTPTGLKELDTKARSSYYSKIGTRITQIYKLYEDKQLTAEEANKLISILKSQQARVKTKKASGSKKKASQKLKIKAIKAPNFQQLKPVQLGNIAPKIQQPKINIQPFKVQSKPLELRLDPRIRAGM